MAGVKPSKIVPLKQIEYGVYCNNGKENGNYDGLGFRV